MTPVPKEVPVALDRDRNRILTLKGQKLDAKKKGDKLAAECTNGILKVSVPKMEIASPASRTVPIAKQSRSVA